MKVAFVCSGDPCRSPMAEAVMKLRAAKAGVVLEVGALNTAANGAPLNADPRTLHILVERRIPPPGAPQEITEEDLETTDHFLAMDRKTLDSLRTQWGLDDGKASLFQSWNDHARSPDVPDPINGSLADFEHLYRMIEEGVVEILRAIEDGRLHARRA